MSDMMLDTDTFDFFSLKDITDEERAFEGKPTAPEQTTAATSEDVGANGGVVDDISDLSELFDDAEAEEAEEREQDPNLNTSDLADPNEAVEALKTFQELPDTEVLDFDGVPMTKADVKELISKRETLKRDSDIANESARKIDAVHNFLERDYYEHQTAIDANIALIEKRMNSNISGNEYGELARQLKQAQEAKSELVRRTDERMRVLEIARQEAIAKRISDEIRANSTSIPQWEQRRGHVLKYAVENGVNLAEVEKAWSPEIAKMFYKSYLYDKSQEKIQKEAISRARSKAAPRSQSSARAAQAESDTRNAKLAQLKSKAKSGSMDERDISNMFEFLVD